MKKLFFLCFLLTKLVEGISVPRTCSFHLDHAKYVVEGRVNNISQEISCWDPDKCNNYDIFYTAEIVPTKIIKGTLKLNQAIKVHYKGVVVNPLDGEMIGPGFQGHQPKPKKDEIWTVFLDKNFQVEIPNGWWNEEEKCWLR